MIYRRERWEWCRGRVSIYQSYYRREETKYNRSEWCSGRALAFKTIGRGFAPGNCFVFFTRPRRRRVSIYQSYRSPLCMIYKLKRVASFNHQKTTGRSGVGVRRRVKKTKRWRGANPRPLDKAYYRQHMLLCWL